MSRRAHLLTCLVLLFTLIAAPAALASPADPAAPWWNPLAQIRAWISGASSDNDSEGPSTDPGGTALTEPGDDDETNMGPSIDPNGLRVGPDGNTNGSSSIDAEPAKREAGLRLHPNG